MAEAVLLVVIGFALQNLPARAEESAPPRCCRYENKYFLACSSATNQQARKIPADPEYFGAAARERNDRRLCYQFHT